MAIQGFIPYQPYDPLESQKKRISLANLARAGQLQDEQLRAAEMDNELQQRGMDEDAALHQAIAESNGDIRTALPKIMQISPAKGMALQKQITEWDTADLNKKKSILDLHAKKLEGLGQLAGTVTDQQSYNAAIQSAVQNGLLEPAEAQQLAQQPYSPELVKGWQQQALTVQQQIENARKSLEDQETARHNKAMEGRVPVDQQEMSDWLAKNPGKGPADFMKYKSTMIPQFRFNLEGGGGGQLNSRQQATVSAILEGRMAPPSSFALKTPYWQNVMGAVFEQDPQFSEQRAQLRKAFTTGKQSSEINAINTAMGHVGVLGDAIDALQNGNLRGLNAIANRYGLETGSTPQAVFKTIVHRVGPELSKAYIGAGGSAGERGSDEKDFDENLAPQTLRANVGITAKLLRSKISSLENQWDQNRGPGMQSFEERFIMPEAARQLEKWAPQGQQAGGAMGQVPAGATRYYQGVPYTQQPDGSWRKAAQ